MKSITDKKQLKQIKNSFYTSEYFIKSKKILNCKMENSKSILQFICFNKEQIVISGINEVIEIIKKTLPKKILKKIEVYGLTEGSIINRNDPILKIIGNYSDFCFLENIIDGILATYSSISTNVYNILKLLNNDQQLIYMADRTNAFFNQQYDAYAAYIGGCKYFTTKAQVQLLKNKTDINVVGTIPHALIQQYDNDLVKLIKDYYEIFNQKPVVLLDYENNVIKTLNQIKSVLHLCSGVRLDTSSNLIDESLKENINANGVSKELIFLVKDWLIKNNFDQIKIYISSGLNYHKIKVLQDNNVPVDVFGVGSNLLTNSVHISADLVNKNNIPSSKVGRFELESKKLKKYI